MYKRNALRNAIVMALATSAGATVMPVYAQEPPDSANADKKQEEQAKDKPESDKGRQGTKEIERMVVTATKTEAMDIQDAPIAVDAMDEAALDELNIGNFDDLVTFQPNITRAGQGPGQNTVFLRGMAIQPITVLLSAAQGTSPNVAIYLDEQPVTAPGRNLDVYMTDISRVEVLPGPQGTLFGASSQAGTIRYISNKPQLFDFDAGITTRISDTREGELSNSVEGFINFPLTDSWAARLAFYNVDRGGYIDNVEGTFTLDPDINPESATQNLPEDTEFTAATNADIAEDDFNDSSYTGFRFSNYWEFAPRWSLLLQHQYQTLEADGVFDYDPSVGDLEVERFFPDELDDTFNKTSWTVEGRLNALNLLYTGAFLDRDIDQSVDYTGYNNAGAFIAYYTCTYTNPDYITGNVNPDVITDVRQCLDPTKGTRIDQEQTRHTHELRVTTPQDKRLRAVTGVFYDNLEIETIDNFHYFTEMPGGGAALGFAPNAPIPEANNIDPSTRPPTVAFFNDITRSEEQIAFFGELSFDFIPDVLTGTVGLRWYEIESDFTGSSNFANGIFQGSVDSARGRDYDVSGGHTPEPLVQNDVIPKFNLAYHHSDDIMIYGTFSQGFRPGGFNRGGGLPSRNPDFPTVDTTYETDDVNNFELGWKTMLFDNSLRFNGAIYRIEWTDMQVSRFDPQNVSILTFIENAADSEIHGLETNASWRATPNLTIHGGLSYNDTELTDIAARAIEIVPEGSELAMTPELQGSLRARYQWSIESDILDYANWQVDGRFATDSWSSIVAEERRKQEGYALFGASVGVTKGPWSVNFYVDNLTDKRAELFINTQDDIERITTVRPRTIGLSVKYRYLPF